MLLCTYYASLFLAIDFCCPLSIKAGTYKLGSALIISKFGTNKSFTDVSRGANTETIIEICRGQW